MILHNIQAFFERYIFLMFSRKLFLDLLMIVFIPSFADTKYIPQGYRSLQGEKVAFNKGLLIVRVHRTFMV